MDWAFDYKLSTIFEPIQAKEYKNNRILWQRFLVRILRLNKSDEFEK